MTQISTEYRCPFIRADLMDI